MFSDEHRLNDKIVILYSGNIGYSQGLDSVLDAVTTMTMPKDVCFVIQGDGPERSTLVARANTGRGVNVQFLPFQPREKLAEVLAMCDVALISLREGIASESIPSKTFPILASARPILACIDPRNDLWGLVERVGCGVCVRPGDAGGFADAVTKLADDKRLRTTMGNNGRKYIEEVHTKQRAVDAFIHILEQP
jgi:colanic acid biosynthesis glycosyl transferase WcaI